MSQTRFGTVVGFVFGTDEQPMPGVTVSIRNETIGYRETAVVSDGTGRFTLPNLPAADGYLLRAAMPGFATIQIRIDVRPGSHTAQAITMRPAAEVAETVEVRARSDVVRTESTDTTTTFDADIIEGLPVIGRNYEDVLVLAPGVQDDDDDGNVNILGSRERQVMTTVDGMDVTDPFTGKDPIAFNLEAIQELELVRAGAGAQYGGKSGGFVNIITKSGSNDFAGAFKFFYRTDLLDGDGAGSDPPQYHGGSADTPDLSDVKFDEFRPFMSLGGAILQDRLWYYFALEYLNIDTPINAVNKAFATNFEGYRNFGKLSWQIAVSNKLALSWTHDPFEETNQGVDSVTAVESGYSLTRGRENWNLQDTYIMSPRVLLQSTLSWTGFGFNHQPALPPDSNGNYVKYRRPANLDRFDPDCTEETPELCDSRLDLDRDGYITDLEDPTGFFDARYRDQGDDFNEDGTYSSDICLPLYNPAGRQFCEADHNHNARKDLPDLDFHRETLGFRTTFGPHFLTFTDDRTRQALDEQLSLEIDDFFGTHSLDLGAGTGRDQYRTDIERRNVLITRKNGLCEAVAKMPILALGASPVCEVDAQIPVPRLATGLEADADRLALFVNDRYKPIPNLTIGLGFRIDNETIAASGYRPFDPQAEARVWRRVGIELANFSGALVQDPLLNGPERFGRVQTLREAAANVFTLPESSPAFDLPEYFLDIRDSLDPDQESKVRSREDFTIENTNLSPRLSVSWDPWGDGKTKVFSTWGRFYDNIFLEAVVQEEAPAFVTRSYLYDYDGIVGGCDFEGAVGCTKPVRGEFNNHFGDKVGGFSPPSVQTVARDLESPYGDEFTLGFEREIAPEFSVGVTYIRRKWSNQLQDTDINHLPVDVNLDGVIDRKDDVIGRLTKPICKPDLEGNTPPWDECEIIFVPTLPYSDGLPDLTLQNFFFNQIFLIDNFNSSEYEGIELTLTRRMHRNWQMQLNYTYSEAVGGAEDFLSELGNDPAATENEYGFLDYDQTHTVKFSALTHLPRDFTLTGIATWSSGYPYSLIRELSSFDDQSYSQFRRIYTTGQRNDQRNNAFYTFSASVMKSVVIGEVSARFRFDVENLLNSDDLRVFDINDASESNQVRGVRRFGRRFEVGIEMFF